tara:strand:- start:1449 stop:2684 length:1236 start_codon:yes stop_codon:yes gene_type:complete
MSNLLERAIIDAKALKEAALKNAEQLVIEKYSDEVRTAVDQLLEMNENQLLEQDDEAMADLFGDNDPAPGAPEGEGDTEAGISADDIEAEIPDAFMADDDEVIQIKLDSLEDEIEDDDVGVFGGDDELGDDEIGIDITDDEAELEADVDMDMGMDDAGDVDIDITPDTLEEIIKLALVDALNEEDEEIDEGHCNAGKRHDKKKLDEEEEIEEDIEIDLDELMERVRVEGTPQKSGWAGTPESIMQEYEAMLLAREQDSEVKEENEELRKTVASLQKENRTLSSAATKLQKQNKKFNAAFTALQEKLETMNVSNAKLLYINQALENASLNERQKRKIVEAISKAGTVQEAKIVFETLNETITTSSDVKKDVTLNEVVSRKSSLLVAARKEQKTQDANPLFNRMQKLAGIKTN